MLLKSLELQGFKTFPEKTVLTFDKGITVVVGPNGSGKSNISDAVRWVLGEQSIKTIRCSKMEDVIFNGTTERKAKGFASVTLTIMNDDRKLPVDEDEVVLTRRFYRSGESEYLINKNEVRLKDIHEIFMDTGLGKDGYSMISQGKIDSIVASKSEDRREIFEEAAGISKYRYRKLQAQKRLDQTEENLLRLYDIFKELEERVGPLKEQAKKAKIYLELANRKKTLEIGTWLFTLEKSNDVLQNYNNKIEISQNQYEEIENRLESFNTELETISAKILNCTVKSDETRRKITEYDEDIIKNNAQISVLQNDILHNNENIQRLTQEALSLEQSFPELEISIKEKSEKLDGLKDKLVQKNSQLENNEQILKSLTDKINTASDDSKRLSDELSNLNKFSSEFQVKIITSNSEIENLSKRKNELEQNVNLYKQKINLLDEKLLRENDILDELKAKSQNSISELKNIEIAIKTSEKNCEELKHLADKSALDVDSQLRKIHLLEELERNFDGFSHSVKCLMKEVQNNTLSGIHGPVSKLIKVPSKFSVAIETALGAAIQNVIVDTEESAKKSIMWLKKNKVGRATFLPISNIKGFELQEKNLNFCQGFLGIASCLCDCDHIYKNILNFLLGKIVVADNLDNAAVIAQKFSYKFKVVTLDGQVINAGGALTGGALGKNSGILSRSEQIVFLQKEYEDLKNKSQSAQNSYSNAKNELLVQKRNFEALKKNTEEIRLNLNKAEQSYQQKVLEKESLTLMYEKFSNEESEIAQKIKGLMSDLDLSEKEFNQTKDKIKAVEEFLQSTGANKNEVVVQRDKVSAKLNDLRVEIVAVKGDIERLSFEFNSILENKKQSDVKQKTLLSQIENLNQRNADIEIQISDINVKSESLKEISKQLNLSIVEINNKKIKFEENITELRKSERLNLNEKEKIALELARLEDKKINVQKEYDTIIAKLWDEYELTRREAVAGFEVLENTSQVAKELNEVRLSIKNLGVVNVAALEEFKQVSERYEFMKSQINDVEKSKKELYRLIGNLTKQMKTLFAERFNLINENFNTVFKELFGGGKAELALTDTADVLNSGIEIYVQPPGKIVTHLEALSGGERALIAIALYFAIMKVSPAPFCFLDEIEAALDDVNVNRFAAYLRKMNKNTQFIAISHRRGTMEEADILYGVTMQNEGISKLLELKATEIEQNFLN